MIRLFTLIHWFTGREWINPAIIPSVAHVQVLIASYIATNIGVGCDYHSFAVYFHFEIILFLCSFCFLLCSLPVSLSSYSSNQTNQFLQFANEANTIHSNVQTGIIMSKSNITWDIRIVNATSIPSEPRSAYAVWFLWMQTRETGCTRAYEWCGIVKTARHIQNLIYDPHLYVICVYFLGASFQWESHATESLLQNRRAQRQWNSAMNAKRGGKYKTL